MVREVRKENEIKKYNLEGVVPFNLPDDCDDNGITFKLIVENEHGLTYSDDTELTKTSIESKFMQWNDRNIDSINSSNPNPDYDVIVGQPIRYYVGVLASAKPTSVTINGVQAAELTDYNVVPQPSGIATSKTVWYIDWTPTNRDTYNMTVVATVDGMTDTRVVGSVKVAGLTVGNNTTNPTKDGETMYVLRNTNYNTTYLTAANDNLSANAELNYYNLFAFENNNRIKSIARGTYCNGTTNNGSISFSNNGTQYSFGTSGQNNRISYTSGRNTYYIRQTSTTDVTLSRNNGSQDWQILPVTLDMP